MHAITGFWRHAVFVAALNARRHDIWGAQAESNLKLTCDFSMSYLISQRLTLRKEKAKIYGFA
jgi:hypothetical protein